VLLIVVVVELSSAYLKRRSSADHTKVAAQNASCLVPLFASKPQSVYVVETQLDLERYSLKMFDVFNVV
jgi:hypothetical protein